MQNSLVIIAGVVILGAGFYFLSGSSTDTTNPDPQAESMAEPMAAEPEATIDEAPVVELDIVDTAVANDDFNTLVTAVTAAELVDTLKSDGPFTVFAPTDDAFAALPDGTVETLLLPDSQADLTNILTYHVVPGAVRAADLSDGMVVETVNGETIIIGVSESGVTVNDASVVAADIETSNGVIHVIDTVLLP